jgi:hypothetical protein
MSRFLVVLALVSGCSVALQKKPPASQVATSECSTTPAFWIADTVGVIASAVAIGAAISMRDDGAEMPNLIGAAGAFAGVGYVASAVSGRRWARECRAGESAPVAVR